MTTDSIALSTTGAVQENGRVVSGNAAPVEFRNVSKLYGTSVTAVDNVSLRVEAGELVTLLGPSGCGKTTTLRMIAGLEKATNGVITIGDTDVTALPATDRDVTMVFQSYALFPHMTVLENVSYGLSMSGLPKTEVRERAEGGLDLVGLSGYGSRLPSELSGGQQQRVAVARALVLEPQVLLFDEPLSNLDAKLRRQVREDIRDIQTRLGLTVVYVTHDQEEALAVSDRIIVMNNAVIAQIGTPRELYEEPVSEFVADFIGEANILDASIENISEGRALVKLGKLRLQLRAASEHRPGAVRLAVRPGRILLGAAGEADSLEGVVDKSTYVGSHMEYRVATDHGTMFVVSQEVSEVYQPGQDVSVRFATTGPVLLSPETTPT
ncbi:sugar ABC transporter substrate-binding protein [Chromatiales bacterium (ex Bugula neritina AB1)]|nr:sugar ABC transporter substrate-binding protein [Chromatiales bacterium (ex Bugula neritina AB1)]